MTPEKLSELEKLEAAVTPGEWETSEDLDIGASDFQIPVTYDDGSEVMPGYTHSMRVVSLPYGQPDTWPRHNAALICALRNNARDLFAALREAWREIEIRDLRLQAYAERDEVRPDLLTQLEEKTDQLWAVEKERDEVRAALRMLWGEFGRSSLVSAETRAAVMAVLGEIP